EGFLLPAGGIEVLAKISFLIQKADTHERNAEIAGGFEMITGENAESPGKNRETFRDAKFEREIGDEEILILGVFALIPGTLTREIGFQTFGDALEMGEEGIVACGGFQKGLIDAAQDTDRIVPGGFPEVAIEAAEEVNGGVVPAPAQVVGDLQERFQCVRQRGADFERGDGLHGVPQMEQRAEGRSARRRARQYASAAGQPRDDCSRKWGSSLGKKRRCDENRYRGRMEQGTDVCQQKPINDWQEEC